MSSGEVEVGTVGVVAVAPAKPSLRQPALYRVIMLNDDYTPMDFVVEVLQRFFGMNLEEATQVMMKVHLEGRANCGQYPKDIAETKAAQVMSYAKQNEHPLLCEIEAVD